jgi:hypothetical protein
MLTSPTPKSRSLPGKPRTSVKLDSINEHKQRVVARLGASTTGMRGQTVYILRCERSNCGHRYCEDGILVARRRCPKCDNGEPAPVAPLPEKTLFD